MSRKKEGVPNAAVFVLVVITLLVSFTAENISERTKNTPIVVTGLASSGRVAINIGPSVNGVPDIPVLTNQSNIQATSTIFEWVNNSDPDGDTTANQLQLSTDYAFATVLLDNETANSPYAFDNLTLSTIYFWRVRTCDSNSECSGYTNDSFFTFICPVCPITGGKDGGTDEINITCKPDWQCTTWGSCGVNRLSRRNCYDANACAEKPPREYQFCVYDGFRVEVPKVVSDFYIGDFAVSDVFQVGMEADEGWKFIHKDIEHMIKIIEINEDGFIIEVSSEPKKYFIAHNGSVTIDVDDDGKDDIIVKSIGKKGEKLDIVMSLVEEEKDLVEQIALLFDKVKTRYYIWIPLLLIIALITIIIHQNKYVSREKKIDKKLLAYVLAAKKKGFTDGQIKNRLSNTGIDESEIKFIFNKIKKL